MPYIYRDENDNITGYSRWNNEENHEFLAPDSQEWIDYVTEKQAAEQAEADRRASIYEEQESGGLKGITVELANAWVLAKLQDAQDSVESVVDVGTAKAAMNKILLAMYQIHTKEMPYLLK